MICIVKRTNRGNREGVTGMEPTKGFDTTVGDKEGGGEEMGLSLGFVSFGLESCEPREGKSSS